MTDNLKKHIEKFITIESTKLSYADSFFEFKILNKKELVLKEGNICKNLFFVHKGCLQIFFIKENGTEQTIDFSLENWWTTDFNAFANEAPSKFSIRCVEPCEILILSKKKSR